MSKNYKLLAWIILIISSALIFFYFYTKGENLNIVEETEQYQDEENWKIYSNKLYNFEIKFPTSWHLYEDFSTNNPIINIYPQEPGAVPPLTHLSKNPHVSIYPNGLAMEGVVGDHRMVDDRNKLFPNVITSKLTEFTMDNDQVWAITTQFIETPSTWNEWGYLWARMDIDNFEETCTRGDSELSEYDCNIFEGDEIIRSGEINYTSELLIVDILKSFKFIE